MANTKAVQTLPDPMTMQSCKIDPKTGFVIDAVFRSPLEIASAVYWLDLAKQGIGRCEDCGKREDRHHPYCRMVEAEKEKKRDEQREAEREEKRKRILAEAEAGDAQP